MVVRTVGSLNAAQRRDLTHALVGLLYQAHRQDAEDAAPAPALASRATAPTPPTR
jgi:hypothetical protein